MPDIDVDFDDSRRGEVFGYLYRKYGKDQVAKTITFSRYRTKSTIRSVGKLFRLETSEVDQLTRHVPDGISTAPLHEILEESEDLREKMLW